MVKEKIYVREKYGDYIITDSHINENKGEGIGYPPRLKFILVNMIGKEVYRKMDGETKCILLRSALEQFTDELKIKYSSMYGYVKHWCKKNGFDTVSKYVDWLYQRQGYKNRVDFQEQSAKKKGFKSYWDERFNGYKKKIGAKRPVDVVNYWAKRKGFDDWLQYQNFLAVKNGYTDRNEMRRIKYKDRKKKYMEKYYLENKDKFNKFCETKSKELKGE